ncbi:YjbH domain-containing protein [Rhodohalobacter sp. SW132]|uniref:YjbH domain-containing protein n=1 Tax=Rhodohalobacter sp. SW132 TaxID=2293433 RepID=UPI0013149DAF|nr:YjbH domain-containing protein [Rhodohalobacter sp. SW132]
MVFLQFTGRVSAQSLTGTTGLFHIPTAEMMSDRTFMAGVHQIPAKYSLYGRGLHDNRYGFATLTFLPRIELMFRYTYLLGVDRSSRTSGPFMDRMVAARVLIIRESGYRPALLFGVHDPGQAFDVAANKYFGANYLVTTKHFSAAGFRAALHAGYAFDLFNEATQVYDGLFGGMSLSHQALPWFEIMAENDSFRWNAAAKLLILNRVQLMAGLMELKNPAGGISYRVTL